MTTDEHNQTLATLHFIYVPMHGLTLAGSAAVVVVVELRLRYRTRSRLSGSLWEF